MILFLFLATLLGAMILGTPIAFAMLLAAFVLMMPLNMVDELIIAQNMFNGADSFPLMAIPFFILAGELMNAGGLSRRLVNFAMTLVGHWRGGLGYVGVVAGCIMASLSGSGAADAAALATILVPMMISVGHDGGRSAGLVASSGVIALVIPPSIGFILFGVVAQVSITRLFLAGIAPGIIMALAIMAVWWFAVRKETTPVRDKASGGQVVAALREGIWALALPVFILVGLRLGFFTPTEAGVFASVYAGFVALFVYGDMKVSQLYGVLFQAAYLTAMIMFLVAAAMAAGWMVTVSGVPQAVVALVEPLIDTPKLLVLSIIVLVLIVGMVMDMVPITLILVPMVMPAIRAAGVDPVYFGVLFMLACAIGLLTPPVGTVLSVVSGVTGLDLWTVIRGIMPFILVLLAILFLMILVPQLITVPLRLLAG